MMFKLLLNVEENALTILMRIQTHSIEIIFSIFEFSFDGPRYSGYLFAFKKEDDGYFNLVKMQEVFKIFLLGYAHSLV